VGADDVEQATFRLPVRTATFMLTDVEGSTHVQEFAPGTMRAAIARHDDLLDEAVSRHGGVWRRQGEGTGVVAAFARASDAVAAALHVQRAVQREGWPISPFPHDETHLKGVRPCPASGSGPQRGIPA
jgi:class 3 adenylate cyclase